MNYLLIIFLFVQNVVFSSNVDQIQIEIANKIISDFKSDLEFASEPAKLQEVLYNIRSKMEDDEASKPLLLDVCLFTLLKKFPATFINAITKIRKEFTLETIFNPKYAALCTIKNIKTYPGNLFMVKHVLKDQEEHQQIDEFIGAKRITDIVRVAFYRPIDDTTDQLNVTALYRTNHNNTLMWMLFVPDNDNDDDFGNDNFEQEDKVANDSNELDESPFFAMQLCDSVLKKTKGDWVFTEDIIGDVVCTFQDGKLFFQQNNNLIRAFNVLPQQDGRYVRRTKGDKKIKYFFVENETDSQDTQIVLLKKYLLLVKALPVLQIGDEAESCRVVDFFRKYGINDIRQGESKNSLYIQSMYDKKYHQFTVTREKIWEQGVLFKNYIINEYNGIYQDIVSPMAKEYPFSNWLKLRFFKSDDPTVPGTLELRYGKESVLLPLNNVVDISCVKCIGDPEDLVGGTNVVFKTIENKWYQFSTNEIIDALTNGEV